MIYALFNEYAKLILAVSFVRLLGMYGVVMKRILLALIATLPLVMLSANVAADSGSSKKDAAALKHEEASKKAAKQATAKKNLEAKKKAKELAKKAKREEELAKKAKAEAKKAAKEQAKREAKRVAKQAKKDKKYAKKKKAHSVPEIDAAGAALALGLLGGIAAIRRERKKSQQK